MQNNRSLTAEEAQRKAEHLYKNTKGLRWYRVSDKVAGSIRCHRPNLEIDGNW